MVGLPPCVDASALAETGAVLEAGDDFNRLLVVVEEDGLGRVEMDVFEVGAALAVAVVAVGVDVVWRGGGEERRTGGGEAEGERHGGRDGGEGTVVDGENGGEAGLDHCVFEHAEGEGTENGNLLNVRRTRGMYEDMLPAPMMLRTSWVLPKITKLPSPSIMQLWALFLRDLPHLYQPQAMALIPFPSSDSITCHLQNESCTYSWILAIFKIVVSKTPNTSTPVTINCT